ncbi:MAG: DUF4900 domain-containing protein [Candidatus Omnitrophica bacterium]|jgi:hypothetical protein|nr:DUF4900 domain-containing protein [Candidatus Omnitrophota bacterium]
MNNNRGMVLAVSLMVMAVLLIVVGAYFSGVFTEKRSADRNLYTIQALSLAEAGANHAVSELRRRIRIDINSRIAKVTTSSTFSAYATNPLGVLSAFAYPNAGTPFSVNSGVATLTIANSSLDGIIQGNYSAVISVQANGAPTINATLDIFEFPYKYSVISQGNITNTNPSVTRQVMLSEGEFKITIRRDNFAKFALFTSHHSTPSGTTVWFTADTNFNGPVSTNDRFSFANDPSATFSELVTQHQTKAQFYNLGNPVSKDADYNSVMVAGVDVMRDKPIFNAGFTRGFGIINLSPSITQTQLKTQALGGMPDNTNGIFVPNNGTAVTGGIYVRGNQGQSNDNPTIVMSVGAAGPVYTITRSGTTKVITLNYTANTTTVVDGSNTKVYTGIPDGVSHEGVLIYVNDDIASLAGVVEGNTKVTVSSERDINITNNITYQNYNTTPTLNATGYNNVLGILSWGGDVIIAKTAPNNLVMHGVVMAHNGIFTVDDYNKGSPRGNVTLLGGTITDFYGAFGTFSQGSGQLTGYGRNFIYDARMLNGTTPPYFPYMTNFAVFDDGKLDSRLTWHDMGI